MTRLIDTLGGAGTHRVQNVPTRAVYAGEAENMRRNATRAPKFEPRLLCR